MDFFRRLTALYRAILAISGNLELFKMGLETTDFWIMKSLSFQYFSMTSSILIFTELQVSYLQILGIEDKAANMVTVGF